MLKALPNDLLNSFTGSKSDFSLEVFRIVTFKSGYHFKTHSHKRIEINYILQGSCVMKLENELIKLVQNNSILVFPGSKHDFYVDSKSGVKIVQLEFQINEVVYSTFKNLPESEFSFLYKLRSREIYYMKIPHNPEIRNCMERIIKENQLKRKGYESLVNIYFMELLILLSRYINRQLLVSEQLENAYLKKAMGIIHENYCSSLSVTNIARECNVSTRYLRRLFKLHLESTPQEYGNNLKIKKASELLADRNIPIKEIAYSVGYTTPQYFSRAFKEKYGFSPKVYRKILFEIQH